MAAGDGLVTMTPTSVDVTGTSASINADGGVDFTAVTSLSLNGVFTSDYDNYLLVINHVNSLQQTNITARLRAAGTDASGTDYTRQYIWANGASVTGARSTSQTTLFIGVSSDEQRSGDHVHLYGPYLAQPTASRNLNVVGETGASLFESACTHSLSTSYDGVTLACGAGNITGTVHVFGYEE